MRWWDGAFWAADTFRRGGDLVDAGGILAARDKVQHLVGCVAVWLLLALLPLGVGGRLTAAAAVAIAIEVVEGARLARWWAASAVARRHGWTWSWAAWAWANNNTTVVAPLPLPPPAFADRPSWRDLVADAAGILLGAGYLWALRGAP